MPRRSSAAKRARPRACRSKYIGAAVRVRGREATVVDCARPKQRPAPQAPIPRLRVTYAKSGHTRAVPVSAIYRAARCSAKPTARGCAPLDVENAPWLAGRDLDDSFDFDADSPLGACPNQITAEQIEAWSHGDDVVPEFFFDTDRPHMVGTSDNCHFSASMQDRMALHARVLAKTKIPAAVRRHGPGAVEKYQSAAIRRAEDADPRGAAWRRNDARILARVQPAHRASGEPLADLKHAFREHARGNDGPAYSLAKKGYPVTSADDLVDEGSLVDALLEAWVENQHSTSEAGRAARIAAFRGRVRRGGAYAVAASIAGVSTGTTRRRSNPSPALGPLRGGPGEAVVYRPRGDGTVIVRASHAGAGASEREMSLGAALEHRARLLRLGYRANPSRRAAKARKAAPKRRTAKRRSARRSPPRR